MVAPKFSGVTFPNTYISGCDSSGLLLATVTFYGQNTCTSFSIGFGVSGGANGATTALNAPAGGEVSVLLGGSKGTTLASFDGNGANFHTSVSIVDGLSAANSGFTVDSVGNVGVGGSLSVAGTKNFQIDDPLDPGNKYMYHASVESSEVMNIYSGNVVTDPAGNAVVQLPAWFEALNGDFRYQLTVIGQFARAIVASKIANHSFRIKTDKPDVEVSWQITGIRQDAYIKAHPFVVEEDKPGAERGYYLHPEVFGQPESKAVRYAHKSPIPKKELEPLKAEGTGD